MFLESLESLLHSPPPFITIPLPPPSSLLLLLPPSLLHHLCSLTVYNAIQGAHGLDGRPGPVVSGASPLPVSPPFSSSSSSSSSNSLPCYSLLACLSVRLHQCFVMSACFLPPMLVLSLLFPTLVQCRESSAV